MSHATHFDKGHDLESKGTQLCLSCGLCCQGLLHDHARLETSDIQPPISLDIRLGLAEGV